MSGLSVRSVPNILSILRMALSPALLLLTDNIPLFVCAYIGIGLSDILDGLNLRGNSVQGQPFFMGLQLLIIYFMSGCRFLFRGLL